MQILDYYHQFPVKDTKYVITRGSHIFGNQGFASETADRRQCRLVKWNQSLAKDLFRSFASGRVELDDYRNRIPFLPLHFFKELDIHANQGSTPEYIFPEWRQ